MRTVANSLFACLDKFRDRIPLAVLMEELSKSDITFAAVSRFLRFHPDRYMRNLMYQGASYQALVLCWRNGQRSPIHDHQGSSCAVKILSGQATETTFRFAPNGMIYPTQSIVQEEGAITGSQDDDIHQISNLQPENSDLVTLHIYSPPLIVMNTYSLTDGLVSPYVEPINTEFADGGGI